MERYESYKDSGVKWLGEIPSHWEVKRLRAALSERKERYNSSESLIILSLIKDKGIIPYDEKGEVGNKSKDDHTQYKVARAGDLVINSMNVIIGSLGISPYDGYISPAYYSFIPSKNVNLAFYNYILSLRKVQQSIRCYSKGIMEIRLKISSYDFLSMPFPFPSLKEQDAIVSYLDAATSKIDAAIAQQQNMIDLLNERKQIIINNAVTKGLDPNAPMKDSGIEWVGMMPKGWELRKLKTLVSKVGSGITPKGGGSVYVDEGIMLLRSQNVYFEGFKLSDVAYITEAMDDNMRNTRVCEGDVLINITGGSIGRCYYVPKGFPRANVNQHVCIVRPHFFSTKYLYYLLRSKCCQIQVDLKQTGGNREGLTSAALKNFILPIPPVNIQMDIIEYLDKTDRDLQSSIELCKNKISLLQERKQIIINDVVTGKVKVV